MMNLHQPLQPHRLNSTPSVSRFVRFRHPGYSNHNIIFTLFGHDSPAGGLHRETAFLACAIVAGNRWDGYLSTSATGLPIEDSELLLGSDYYFIVPPPSQDTTLSNDPSAQSVSPMPTTSTYPIVPCFQEWSFPHDRLPALWNTLPQTYNPVLRSSAGAVNMRDGSCRVTNNVIECDVAHLCPRSEITWFRSNDMEQYVSQQSLTGDAIDDPANALLLRSDIHCAFDKLQFVFIPKADSVLVTHVLASSNELRDLYHNAALHQVGAAPQFLLARFAWAIFPLLTAFLQKGQRRLLKLATEQEERWFEADECFDLSYNTFGRSKVASKSKPASPTKRSRHDADVEYIDEVKEDIVRRSEPKKTQDSTGDDSLSSTANPANDTKTQVQKWLEFERARSDPEGKWQTELKWYKGILDNGGGLDSSELPRYLSVIGGETMDDDGL